MSELVGIGRDLGRDLGIDEQAIREAAGAVALRGSGATAARITGGEPVQRARTLGVSVVAHGGRTRIGAEGRNGMLAGGLFGGITRSRRQRIARMAQEIADLVRAPGRP